MWRTDFGQRSVMSGNGSLDTWIYHQRELRTFLCVRMWCTPNDMQPKRCESPFSSSLCQTVINRRFLSSSSNNWLKNEMQFLWESRIRYGSFFFSHNHCVRTNDGKKWGSLLTRKTSGQIEVNSCRRWSPFCSVYVSTHPASRTPEENDRGWLLVSFSEWTRIVNVLFFEERKQKEKRFISQTKNWFEEFSCTFSFSAKAKILEIKENIKQWGMFTLT